MFCLEKDFSPYEVIKTKKLALRRPLPLPSSSVAALCGRKFRGRAFHGCVIVAPARKQACRKDSGAG